MAARRPIVRVGGRNVQLPAGDTLEGVTGGDNFTVTGTDTTTDFNTLTAPGHYEPRYTSDCPNAPSSVASRSWKVDVFGDAEAIVQIATPIHPNAYDEYVYIRLGRYLASWSFGSGWIRQTREPRENESVTSFTSKTINFANYEIYNVTLDRSLTAGLTVSYAGAPTGVYQVNFIQDATGGWKVATINGVSGFPGKPDIDPRPGSVTSYTFYVVKDVGCYVIGTTPWGAANGMKPVARIPSTQRHIANCVTGTAITTLALTAARIYFIPFVAPRRMKVSQLGIAVSTLTAGTGTLGIYAADGAAAYDYPGTLLASSSVGAVNTGATGSKMATVEYTLEAGVLYFIAFINSSAATVRAVAIAGQSTTLGHADNSTGVHSGYINNGSTNVLPASAAAPINMTGASIPAIYIVEA